MLENPVDFIQRAESLTTVDYRLYDAIRGLKLALRRERAAARLAQVTNPDRSTALAEDLAPGLIDDFQDLDWEYDFPESESEDEMQ